MEDLITYSALIFEDLHGGKRPPVLTTASVSSFHVPSVNPSVAPTPQYAPTPPHLNAPLPVLPAEETPSGVDYGSSFTKITTLPSRPSTSREQDFSPSFPLRPPQSIHPSHRTNTSSSTSAETSQDTVVRPPSTPRNPSFPEHSSEPSSPASPAPKASYTYHPELDEETSSPPEPVLLSDGSPLSDYMSYVTKPSADSSPAVERTEGEVLNNGSSSVQLKHSPSTGATSAKSARTDNGLFPPAQ